jgi:putative transposase
MPQSLACINIHIVFSTKNRQRLIGADWSDELYAYMSATIEPTRSVLLCAGGTSDHVHLLISMGREASVAELVRLMKSNSSTWVHEKFPSLGSFGWQAGYAAFSVSYSQLEQVKAYIRNQADHHRKVSFQDELRALLRKHNIEWDERYIWD